MAYPYQRTIHPLANEPHVPAPAATDQYNGDGHGGDGDGDEEIAGVAGATEAPGSRRVPGTTGVAVRAVTADLLGAMAVQHKSGLRRRAFTPSRFERTALAVLTLAWCRPERPGAVATLLAVGVLASALGIVLILAGLPQRGAPARSEPTEPVPPVVAADFPTEALGVAPLPGDGRIPNPSTPTGVPIGSAPACSQTVVAGADHSSSAVNRLISGLQDRIVRADVVCLSGTFHQPIHIWGKADPALLVIEALPGGEAVVSPGQALASAVNPNEYDGVAGAVSVVDSTAVEVRGLSIEGYWALGPAETPAGIYAEVRGAGFGGSPSACFTRRGRSCGDIYLIDNHISGITNRAAAVGDVQSWCDNPDVDAFGIDAEAYGRGPGEALQHVVIEGNTITGTLTGQSETVAINGDVTDYLIARNVISDTDNIGIDTEGWYDGTGQASHGLVLANTVADVDSWANTAYGTWDRSAGRCEPLPPNAAGIYDDGATYVWIADNLVAQTDQGISLDTETPGRWSDHLLVSGNLVWDSRGARLGDPSVGPNPPGVAGRSDVAGHAYDAFYVDAFGPGSSIYDVYAYDNHFANASRYFGGRHQHHDDVVALGGRWKDVLLWDNTITGGGASNPWVSLLGVDERPLSAAGTTIDCNDYEAPTSAGTAFTLGSRQAGALATWQQANGYGWDAHSLMGRAAGCPPAVPWPGGLSRRLPAWHSTPPFPTRSSKTYATASRWQSNACFAAPTLSLRLNPCCLLRRPS